MTAPLHSSSNRSTIEPLEARIAPATFLVLNLNDGGPGSLRDAVADANAAASDDRIVFQAGLAGRITLTTGEIAITDDLVIRGPATGAIKISGDDVSRIFLINDGVPTVSTVKLINLTLRDGFGLGDGGAIQGTENLTLKNSVLRDNNSSFSGGAVILLATDATLKVANTRFVANTAAFVGGALEVVGPLSVRNSVFSGNTSGGPGGAIEVFGSADDTRVEIVGTVFQDNEATGVGGAIHLGDVESAAIRNSVISGNAAVGANQHGGGIHLDTSFLTLTRTTIAGNTATGEGGGLSVGFNSAAFVDDSVLKRNEATGHGGGIVSNGTLVVTDSKIVNNFADAGGGIRTPFTATGDIAIINTLIKGNTSTSNGGGLNLFSAGSKLIDHCVITGNSATGLGGGLRAAGGDTLMVIATTIANNSADTGGGVSTFGLGLMARFIDSFIIDNTATTLGGGFAENTTNDPVLQNTPVTGNTAPTDPQTSGVFLIG